MSVSFFLHKNFSAQAEWPYSSAMYLQPNVFARLTLKSVGELHWRRLAARRPTTQTPPAAYASPFSMRAPPRWCRQPSRAPLRRSVRQLFFVSVCSTLGRCTALSPTVLHISIQVLFLPGNHDNHKNPCSPIKILFCTKKRPDFGQTINHLG